MLYLDASALVKRYSAEKGSKSVSARFERNERIFTSMLSFAEVHSSLGRKFRDGELTDRALGRIREEFLNDWLFGLSVLDLDVGTMSAIPSLVEKYELRAGDAIHLSTVFWLRDTFRLRGVKGEGEERLEFGVADKRLAGIAELCGLRVFNPENQA